MPDGPTARRRGAARAAVRTAVRTFPARDGEWRVAAAPGGCTVQVHHGTADGDLRTPGGGRNPGAGTRPARAARPTIASGAAGRFALAGAKRERRLPARYGPAPEVPAAPAPPPSGSSVLMPGPASRAPCGRGADGCLRAGADVCVRGTASAECPPASERRAPFVCVAPHVSTRRPKAQTQCRARSGHPGWWDVSVAETATGRSPGEARERYERHVWTRRRHLRRSDPA